MVLKKPYAFIIKHFRAIHLLLLIPILYLIIKTRAIVYFFNSYVTYGYNLNFSEVLTNISSHYINILMYISVILILLVFVAMSVILQQKDKPTKLYNICIIYYVIIFLLITVCFSLFNAIEADTLDDILSRFVRDIGFIIYISEYAFAGLTFIRGIGFNIKKFNFKSDLEDLEISNEDNEEFEFLVGKDIYQTKRTIRRFFRELKYYYLENKFIVHVIVVIGIVILGTFIYMNREIKEKVYKENESFTFGSLSIKVKDSYVSNLNNNGKIINNDKSYVILILELKNRYTRDIDFNYENLGLIVNKKRIQPNISIGNNFSDYGNPYSGGSIKGESTLNCILVYEIDKYLINSNFKLESYSRIDTKGGLGIINREIKINPSIVNSNISVNTVNKGTNIELNRTSLKKTNLNIKDYELTNRYEYQVCRNETDCITSSNSIFDYPNGYNNKTLLVLDYSLTFDENSIYASLNRDYKSFFNDFLEIKYNYNNRDYTIKVDLLNPENYQEKLIMMVPKNINNAESIYAIITIRNVSYQIKLR